MLEGVPAPAAEEKFLRLDGQVLDVVMASMPTTFEGRPAVQVAMYDITERKRAEALLVQQALHDGLTGLPNRTFLEQHLRDLLENTAPDCQAVSLLIIDLDRFKEVNDSLGHRYGDIVLRQVTERWQSCLTPACFLARIGGDEFAVVARATNRASALKLGHQLQQVLEPPFTIEGHRFGIGASIGVAAWPDHGQDAEMLQRRADMAMYAAKQKGSGCLEYVPAHDLNRPERLSLVSDLREAIDAGHLVLHYQPQIGAGTGEVHGFEALVRWQHPRRGLVGPDAFIPLAEDTGLIGRVTRWVLEQAIRDAARWRRDGFDISVSVNVSVRDLHDPELARLVQDLLEQHRLPATCLKLEITESSLMAEPERAATILGILRQLGVRISIDDFGTGYSSLAYLKGLPVDEIKLDRSFIKELTTTPADRAIVRATIALGHDLGMRVVAEGVEDRETLEFLHSLNCDVAQGYLIARPQPAPEMTRWLDSRRDNTSALAA